MESRCSYDWIINHSILHRRIVTNYIDRESKCTTQVFCLVWACSKVRCNNLSYPAQFSSVTQSCPILCDPMDCSTPGFPVHQPLLELAQTHVHLVSDAIQQSHLLSSPSPAFNVPQNQGLFQWAVLCIWWPKYWSFNFSISLSNEYSGLIFFRIDWFVSLLTKGLSRVFSSTIFQKCQFLGTQLSLWSNSHIPDDYWKNHSFDYMDFCWQSDVSAF